MTSTHPLPPHQTHTTSRLTHAQAHTFLSRFLTLSDTNPAYRPDAHLTDRGPVSTSTGAADPTGQAGGLGFGGNLVLNNLRRVLVGIEGRRVGGASFDVGGDGAAVGSKRTAGRDEEEGGANRPSKRARREVEIDDVDGGEVMLHNNDGPTGEDNGEGEEQGWQDKNDYEMAQEDVLVAEAEDDEAQPAVGQGTTSGRELGRGKERRVRRVSVPERGPEDGGVEEDEGMGQGSGKKMSKEERKKAKRMKLLEEKKVRAAERAEKAG